MTRAVLCFARVCDGCGDWYVPCGDTLLMCQPCETAKAIKAEVRREKQSDRWFEWAAKKSERGA